MDMIGHWHVAGGLAGYGPDGPDGFGIATNWRHLADMLAGELDGVADYLTGTAEAVADSDKAAAWDLHKEAERADTLARNLSNSRAGAPLFAGRPEFWDAEVERLVGEHFPYYYEYVVGPGDAARLGLYAWACEMGQGCEHAADED